MESLNVTFPRSSRTAAGIRWLRVVIILLAVTACLPPGDVSAKEPRGRITNPNALFPTRIGLFVRNGKVELDDAGDPLAHYTAGSLVLASVYYYRTRGHTLQREYLDCRDQVKIASPNARLVSDSAFSVAGRRGKRAIFVVTKGRLVGRGPAKSQLLIFGMGDRFLKFRITYPQANAVRAEEEIDGFLRSFPSLSR